MPQLDGIKPVMSASALAQMCRKIALDYKTCYGKGMCGRPISASAIAQMERYYPQWYASHKKELLEKVGKDYFGFDCVCLIKAILWGWNGNRSSSLGGASYLSGGVPDVSTSGILDYCLDTSEDFGNVAVGELLWVSGHVGIYLGDGIAAECSLNASRTRDGVLLSSVANTNRNSDGFSRRWDRHGKLVWVSYDSTVFNIGLPQLERGFKTAPVRSLQALINASGTTGRKGKPLDIDGSFGADTEYALGAFQEKAKFKKTQVADEATWKALLGV